MSDQSTTQAFSAKAVIGGVIGSPIGHSLSPALHMAWIKALQLDAVYIPLQPDVDHFEAFVLSLRHSNIRGLNVTLPFKERALQLADDQEALAKDAAAANLLLFQDDGRIAAYNTDGIGLLSSLARQAPHWQPDQGPITIFGAGGAARGAVAALAKAGATDIRVLNRNKVRAEAISHTLPCRAFGWDNAKEALDQAETLINATSAQITTAGFAQNSDDVSGFPLPEQAPSSKALAFDMVYVPLKTPFLIDCEKRGFRPIDGLDMLIGQARPSFSAIFGQTPPENLNVRAILCDLLDARQDPRRSKP